MDAARVGAFFAAMGMGWPALRSGFLLVFALLTSSAAVPAAELPGQAGPTADLLQAGELPGRGHEERHQRQDDRLVVRVLGAGGPLAAVRGRRLVQLLVREERGAERARCAGECRCG